MNPHEASPAFLLWMVTALARSRGLWSRQGPPQGDVSRLTLSSHAFAGQGRPGPVLGRGH
eukprot:13321481-Alexandrium_andersonii.AAC.1